MKRVITVLVVCVVGAAMVVFIVRRHSHKLTPVKPASRPIPAGDQRTLDAWAKHTFTPVDESAAFKQKIFDLPIQSQQSLTPQQQRTLHQSAYEMTMAFYLCTYDAYRKFRTPVEPKGYDAGRIDIMKKYCATDWKNPDHAVP